MNKQTLEITIEHNGEHGELYGKAIKLVEIFEDIEDRISEKIDEYENLIKKIDLDFLNKTIKDLEKSNSKLIQKIRDGEACGKINSFTANLAKQAVNSLKASEIAVNSLTEALNLTSKIRTIEIEIHRIRNSTDNCYKDFVIDIKNKAGANATKNTYRHITDVALKLVTEYATNNPNKLNKSITKLGVTSALIESLINHFEDKEERNKAKLIGKPNIKTATKHIKIAYKELGYPEYKRQ